MTQGFDKDYWESHWQQVNRHGAGREITPNPYLERETGGLVPGTALDAGCGEGAEALWLAAQGWQVTAADISTEVLSRASERAKTGGATAERVRWVEADVSTWEPGEHFDLVTTHYAHPAMPQLAFYQRISDWVAPGGTLLIVGHLDGPDTTGHGDGQGRDGQGRDGRGHDGKGHDSKGHDSKGHDDHGHHPPQEASASSSSITAGLDATQWEIVTAEEHVRTLTNRADRAVQLHDVVVRATRRS